MKLFLALLILVSVGCFTTDTHRKQPNDKTVNEAVSEKIQQPQTPTEKIVFISNLDWIVGESNSSWSRFSYKFNLTNSADHDMIVDAYIQWQDDQDFELDTSQEYNLLVPASTTITVSGSDLIDSSIASLIKQVTVTIKG
jgi:hypothetical protein